MIVNEMSQRIFEAAIATIGDGPVALVSLLWLREKPRYPEGLSESKPTAKEAYFDGYA